MKVTIVVLLVVALAEGIALMHCRQKAEIERLAFRRLAAQMDHAATELAEQIEAFDFADWRTVVPSVRRAARPLHDFEARTSGIFLLSDRGELKAALR